MNERTLNLWQVCTSHNSSLVVYLDIEGEATAELRSRCRGIRNRYALDQTEDQDQSDKCQNRCGMQDADGRKVSSIKSARTKIHCSRLTLH